MWSTVVDGIRRLNPMTKADALDQIRSLPWCKPEWGYPSNKGTHKLMSLTGSPQVSELQYEVDEIIENSKTFPIKFPINSVRLEQLKNRRSLESLQRNINSTYPLIHERVLLLMADFLVYKREFGSEIEKALYKDMTVPELIDRLLLKRAVSFLRSEDKYLLLTGEMGYGGWETIGTEDEKPPLILANCLSYDELKLSAMFFVSGYTSCINDGARKNRGIVKEDNIEKDAVIIGLIGTRFARKHRMAYEDIVITEQQNVPENGYGSEESGKSAKHMWRQLWANFYEVPSYTYKTVVSKLNIHAKAEEQYAERFVNVSKKEYSTTDGVEEIFDNEVYYKRLVILAESTLAEAQARGRAAGKNVFLNIIGCGLGVWMVSLHQSDVYVLTFLERLLAYMDKGLLNNVTDVNFAYIEPSRNIERIFSETTGSVKRRFLKCKEHPQGGINIQLENREPSSRLTGEHEGKLLVMTYPWDGNAHPGNEFWIGVTSGSGDSAAACSTQVSELHNAHVNPRVSSGNVRIAANGGLHTVADYCDTLGHRPHEY